ncbi:MAG: DUF3108 domain-containing protein [Burkholderiaceae bacterium]|nr:DUF3108 domain-containing protein [Burkholderiaceae bacterium]
MGARQMFVFPPVAWKRVAALVLVAHLLILIGLDRLIGLFSTDDAELDPNQTLSVQMLSLPVPTTVLPPRSPAPPPPPAVAEPLPAIIEPVQLAQAPEKPGGDLSSEAVAAAPHQDMSVRIPQLEELPRVGGVALSVFWGDHKGNSPIAKGSIELSFPAENRYQIRLITKALGWASIFAPNPLYAETVGRLGPGGFMPERYTHRSPRGKEEISIFDYENKKIIYSSLKESLPLPNGIQDRLSFMIQLAWMMKVDPEQFSLGATVPLPMAGRNKIEEVSFTVMSDTDIVLPGGVLVPAVHLSSYRAGERFKGQIDVWLDRTDRLLPVRIRFEEARGQVLDLLTVREP